MNRVTVFVALASACSFSGGTPNPTADIDAAPEVDAPIPPSPQVRIIEVTSSIDVLRPGVYGFEVSIVVENDLDVEITEVAASLSFSDQMTNRSSDFHWRDVDTREGVATPTAPTIDAKTTGTYRFVVDALASAAPPGPISIDGAVQFTADGMRREATAGVKPLALAFETSLAPSALIVNSTVDENDGDTDICLREAIRAANQDPSDNRIVFDPSVFPPGGGVTSVLDVSLGPLPAIAAGNGRVVIDGTGADFTVAFDDTWEALPGSYVFRVDGSSLLIHGISITNSAFGYEFESLMADNCGSGNPRAGGAILVSSGALILQSTTIADPLVAARNCFGASVRITGGSGHRFRDNHFTDPAMDAIFVDGDAIEIADNIFDGGADPSKGDDAVVIDDGATVDIWIVGNIFLDQPIGGLLATAESVGTVHVINNTFGRNGTDHRSSIIRDNGARTMALANNLHFGNRPFAFDDMGGGNGTGLTFAFEATFDNTLCNSCDNAAIGDTITGDPMLVDGAGTTRGAMTPSQGSPLIASGFDLVDRNGPMPGRFNGQGPERGAVETITEISSRAAPY